MVFLSSCEFSDTEKAEIPAYLYIPSFNFLTDTTSSGYEGYASCKYPDMWVSAAGTAQGTIGLPVLIPVIGSGDTKIGVEAGIIKSGQDEVRIPYPFLGTYFENVTLKPGVTDTIRPVFRYLDNVRFPLIVDYDRLSTSRGFKMNPQYAQPGDTLVQANDNGSMVSGNAYLKCEVAASSVTFQMVSSEEYTFPGQGSQVYLEVDYRSNMLLKFGYYFQEPNQIPSSATPVMDIYPTTSWKKLYINLTDEVASRRSNTKFKFYFGFFNTSGTVKPELSFDNIKLVSF